MAKTDMERRMERRAFFLAEGILCIVAQRRGKEPYIVIVQHTAWSIEFTVRRRAVFMEVMAIDAKHERS